MRSGMSARRSIGTGSSPIAGPRSLGMCLSGFIAVVHFSWNSFAIAIEFRRWPAYAGLIAVSAKSRCRDALPLLFALMISHAGIVPYTTTP